MVKGLKNAYLMHFPSLHSWFRCSVCFYLKCSSSHNQRVIQRVKKHFFVKICFKSCIIKNRSQMYTSEKNTKQLTVRGGGLKGGTESVHRNMTFFADGFPQTALPIFFQSLFKIQIYTHISYFLSKAILSQNSSHFHDLRT